MKPEYAALLAKGRVYSEKHPPIPNRVRAAQFAPFAALTGFDETVQETARQTQQRRELTEGETEMLDRKLQFLQAHIREQFPVEFTWFVPDAKKSGGDYCTHMGILVKSDAYARRLVLTDGTEIPLDALFQLEGACFEALE